MSKYILGVDPGLGGGLALIDPSKTEKPRVFGMPVLTKKGTKKRHIDLESLKTLIDMYAHEIHFMVIEDVHSMPNQGVASMFTFGKVFGIVIGMVAGHGIPIHYAQPQVWKGLMGLSSNKKEAIQKAFKMFGLVDINDGMAEAALIAKFGERFL